MPYWDENSYPECATVRIVTDEDEQGWGMVKGRKETNVPIETQIMMKEVNSGGGTRCDVLEVTMNSEEDFPVLKADALYGAVKQVSTNKKKMPKKSPPATVNQENRTNGEVVRLGRTVSERSPTSGSRPRARYFPVNKASAILFWELWPTTTTTSSSPSEPRTLGISV